MGMSGPVLIDKAVLPKQQQSISWEILMPEARKLAPIALEFRPSDFDDNEKDDDGPLETDSPEPERHFPAHQSNSSLHGTVKAFSQLDDEFCFLNELTKELSGREAVVSRDI